MQHAVFPAQIQDCKCAVRYLRAHAKELGIDSEHIGAWGESAAEEARALSWYYRSYLQNLQCLYLYPETILCRWSPILLLYTGRTATNSLYIEKPQFLQIRQFFFLRESRRKSIASYIPIFICIRGFSIRQLRLFLPCCGRRLFHKIKSMLPCYPHFIRFFSFRAI